MLFGLISNWLANNDYVALDRQAEAMIDLYMNGLRGNAPRRPRQRHKRKRRASGAR